MEIRRKANLLANKYGTRNPLEIVKELNVILITAPLIGVRGFYQYFKRNNIIYVDEKLSEHDKKFVIAHELGHMFFHKKSNFIFMDTHTQFNTVKYEIEANRFAIELLVHDSDLLLFRDYSLEQIAVLTGYDVNLIKLKHR